MNEYPLYPILGEEAKKEAQKLMDEFKEGMLKTAKEVLGSLYCDVSVHIESDSWTNFGNQILDGYKDYNNRKIQAKYDFKEIRQAILKEHREDIIADLNQDMVKEIEDLKHTIEIMNRSRY